MILKNAIKEIAASHGCVRFNAVARAVELGAGAPARIGIRCGTQQQTAFGEQRTASARGLWRRSRGRGACLDGLVLTGAGISTRPAMNRAE